MGYVGHIATIRGYIRGIKAARIFGNKEGIELVGSFLGEIEVREREKELLLLREERESKNIEYAVFHHQLHVGVMHTPSSVH